MLGPFFPYLPVRILIVVCAFVLFLVAAPSFGVWFFLQVYHFMLQLLRHQSADDLLEILSVLAAAEGDDVLCPFESPLLLEALEHTKQQMQRMHCSSCYYTTTSSNNSNSSSSSSNESPTVKMVLLLLQDLLRRLPPPADKMHIVYQCQGRIIAAAAAAVAAAAAAAVVAASSSSSSTV